MAGRPRKAVALDAKASEASSLPPSAKMDSRQYRNFICILYPDCTEHVNMMHYLDTHGYAFSYAAVLHDRDVYEDDFEGELDTDGSWKREPHKKGDIKKAHWHVLIHCMSPYTLSAFTKFWAIWEKHFQVCSSVSGSLMYFMHDTPDSAHKAHYEYSELFGDKKLLSNVKQNEYLVQLKELIDVVADNNGDMYDTLTQVLEQDSSKAEYSMKVAQQYQSFINLVARQKFQTHLSNKQKELSDRNEKFYDLLVQLDNKDKLIERYSDKK